MKAKVLPGLATITLLLWSAAAVPPAWAGAPVTLQRPATEGSLGAAPSWWEGDYAFGTWGGGRQRLAESGVTFESYYVNNLAGNPVGGRREGGFTYVDNWYLGITFDLEKLFGWRGAQFAVSAVDRNGRSLTEEYVGSQYNSQQVFGGQTLFLYNLTLEQRFWDDKAKLKLGRFGASDDFNTSQIYGLYMNNGINGNIRNVLFDTQFSAYPFATWAARLRIDPTPEWNAQVGVFQTWQDIFDPHHHGVDWGISDDDGVFLIAQVSWTPEFFKQPVPGAVREVDGKAVTAPTEMKGLPGHYWIGGSLSPWNGYRQFGKTEPTRNSYGFYGHADQMVYQEKPGSEEGLTLWAASGFYPQENISIIPFQLNLGAFYTGLVPNRGRDRTILGVIYGRFGADYARTVNLAGGGDPDYELVVEAAYRVQFTKFAYLQPDLQWIVRPGGTGDIPDALVLGAQIGITF